MAEKKKVFRWFDITEYDEEGEFLSTMQKNGWKFVKAGHFGLYTFEKCQPEDVVYKLDYNNEGKEHKDEYIKMFQDCGWEYICDVNGYSYFRRKKSDKAEDNDIFCDDESRLEMMKHIFAGRVIPLIAIFFFVILPNIFINDNEPLIVYIFLVCFVLYLILFLRFAVRYFRFRSKVLDK